jgi:hypothetical protein
MDDFDVLVDVGGLDFAVGAGDHDDGVLAVVSEVDGGEARGAGDGREESRVDSRVGEILDELRAVDVVAYVAEELDGIAEARGSDGLVGSFASGRCAEAGADDGLTGAGDLRGAG